MKANPASNNDYLYKAILSLKDEQECKAFLETLCTTQELRSFSQRLTVARMLYENCVYNQIVSETGASTATISRVSRSMQDGNGYETIFERLRDDA